MPIPTRIYDLSATASSNSPAGSDTVGTTWDDFLRAIQGIVRGDLATKGADIISAATTDLGAVQGLAHDITGTTTITSFGTVAAGVPKIVKFEGVLTLTHNATSLILPGGANIATADGDIAFLISEGSGNWRCLSFQQAKFRFKGDALTAARLITLADRDMNLGITLGTLTATTSGTSIDFTSIPSGVREIAIMFNGVSTNGTDGIWLQIGDSGGIETTGYNGNFVNVSNSAAAAAAGTTSAYGLANPGTAGSTMSGTIVLSLMDATTFLWAMQGSLGDSNQTRFYIAAGAKALSAELDRVRLTTSAATNTFDAGTVNIAYKF